MEQSSDLPAGPAYAYHLTEHENLSSIRSEGIRPDTQPHDEWMTINDAICYASSIVTNQSYPVDRNRVVYLLDDLAVAESYIENHEKYTIITVDLDGFDRTLYGGLMGPITSLIQQHDAPSIRNAAARYRTGKIEDGSRADAITTLIQRHVASLERIEQPTEPIPHDMHSIELFTPDRIPPDHLVEAWPYELTKETCL